MTRNYKSIVILSASLLFIAFILPLPVFSKSFLIDESLTKKPLGPFLSFLEDKDSSLTIDDIQKPDLLKKWKTTGQPSPGFGFTQSTYWVKLTLNNITQKEMEVFLEQQYPLIDSLKVYIPEKSNKFKVIHVGDHVPFNARPFDNKTFIIPLKIIPKTQSTFYLQQKTSSSMNFILNLWSGKNLQRELSIEYRVLMFYYGIILVMILYNLSLFLFVRRIEYLHFVFFITFFILFVMTQNGTAFQFLWPNSPWWANFFVPLSLCLMLIFAYLFTIEFLMFKKIDPFLYKLSLHIFIPIIIFITILCLFLSYQYAMILSASITAISVFLAMFAGIRLSIKKVRSAFFYTVSWSIFLLGAMLYILVAFGIVHTTFITVWSLQLGSSALVVFLSIALADTINNMRNELIVLNAGLEDKVRDRTEELEAANEELEAMNERLKESNENLHTLNSVLETTNQKLIETNNELEEAQLIAKKDMEMASLVQTTLFPKEPPKTSQWDISFKFTPMSGVSGDFFDFYISGNTLTGISIFDVSGHGISSGLITMIAKSIFFRHFNNGSTLPLNRIIENANKELINEIGEVSNFLTGVILRFNDFQIEYVNASHCDLILKTAKTNNVEIINPGNDDFKGMLLGLKDVDTSYKATSFDISYNDTMLLYTDCLMETVNSSGEVFGLERIKNSFKNASNRTAKESLEHIINDFNKFIDNEPLLDDLTVIVIKKIS